jgi:hypothetical protein
MMNRLIRVALLLPLLAAGPGQWEIGQHISPPSAASHSFTVVQTKTCQSTGGGAATFTCAFLSAVTAGDAVLVAYSGTAYSISSISPGTVSWFPATFDYGRMGVITGVTGATITYTPASIWATYGVIQWEVAGVNASSPLDTGSSAAVGMVSSYAAPPGTGSVTTTGAHDEVCGLVVGGESQTFTPGSGYNSHYGSITSGAGSPMLMECGTSIATPGAYNPLFSSTGVEDYFGTGSLALN